MESLDTVNQVCSNNNPYGIVEYDDFQEFLETLALEARQSAQFDCRNMVASDSNEIISYSSLIDDHQGNLCANMASLELVEDKYATDSYGSSSMSIRPVALSSPGRSSSSSSDSWNAENDPVYNGLGRGSRLGSVGCDRNQNKQVPLAAEIMRDKLVNNLGLLINRKGEGKEFNLLVEQILSDELLLLNAVFHKQGSRFIIKLIKKVKKTDYAFALTQILAPWFYELATHHTARIVVESCLNYLGTGPNEVLYEQAIRRVPELGTNEMGCLSLKECIDTITGEQRTRLMNHIACFSDYLSRDSYGNYVVQHVLQLKEKEINYKILKCLEGKFVALSQKKGGSHVVERCLECCPVGTDTVVREILRSPTSPYLLARHPTGNYVVQKALIRTKELCRADLFGALVKSLEPHKRELVHFTGGKHVMNLMKD